MKKEIKVKLDRGFFDFKNIANYFFPIEVLKENFKIKFVDSWNEAEVIFKFVERDTDFSFLKEKKKKIILISMEDLFIKRNIFNIIESFFHKVLGRKRKYKIIDKLDSVIPKFISSFPVIYFFPRHLKFIKKISGGKVKNAYVILQNEVSGKNILIIPAFLNLLYNKMAELTKKKRLNMNSKKRFCAFIVSSNSSRERVKFFKLLSKYKQVDSYGRVMNNMGDELFKSEWYDGHSKILRNYKFVICFENNFSREYITEKLPNAMLSSTVPIYRGAQNIGEYFDTKSLINYDDYGSYKRMIEKIIELDSNDKKYKKFLKQPWFKNNKIPRIIKSKERELIDFYKKILEQ